MGNFQDELKSLINKCSMENGSNTPDFILAEFLSDCLNALNLAVNRRQGWFGRPSVGVDAVVIPGPNPPGSLGSALLPEERE